MGTISLRLFINDLSICKTRTFNEVKQTSRLVSTEIGDGLGMKGALSLKMWIRAWNEKLNENGLEFSIGETCPIQFAFVIIN